MYTVYAICSELTNKIYIGQTNNLEKRLLRHNGILPTKKGSYTQLNRGPWRVIFRESYTTRQEALKRERYLKSHIGRDYLRRISGR